MGWTRAGATGAGVTTRRASRTFRAAGVAAGLLAAVPAGAAAQDADYAPVPRASWPAPRGGNPLLILQPLWVGHPETLEGAPTLRVDLRREGGTAIVVDLVLGNLLDDATRDIGYPAVFARDAEGWVLTGLGTRRRCAEGRGSATRPSPGPGWTTRPCP